MTHGSSAKPARPVQRNATTGSRVAYIALLSKLHRTEETLAAALARNAAQDRQITDLRARLANAMDRANKLGRRCAELSEKHALSVGAPAASRPITESVKEPAA